MDSFVTPNALFFKRNHLPVPRIKAGEWALEGACIAWRGKKAVVESTMYRRCAPVLLTGDSGRPCTHTLSGRPCTHTLSLSRPVRHSGGGGRPVREALPGGFEEELSPRTIAPCRAFRVHALVARITHASLRTRFTPLTRQHKVTSTIQCAGNRRTLIHDVKPVSPLSRQEACPAHAYEYGGG